MTNESVNQRRVFHHRYLVSARSFRLLNLQPSPDAGLPLEVELFQASLDTALLTEQRYEALSYVWGARSGTRPLTCNGELLLVTPSCDSALRHLRMKTASRMLWVDAICIDQEDTDQGLLERNTQVPLMGEIYAKAARTLCWLGEGTPFTGDVMHHLERIGTCPSQRGLSKLMHYEEILRQRKMLSEEACCLDHIFCHTWHSRLWTVQEVAFSSNCEIVCGKFSIGWNEYSSAAKFLIYEQFINSLDLQAAKSMVSIDMRDVLRDYLLNRRTLDVARCEEDMADDRARQIVFLTSCMTDVNHLQATNPKDKIYGMYAMFSDLGISLPAVDYGKPVAHVYTDAALAMIAWSASLKVLGDASSISRDSALPSWVPDWNDAEVRMSIPVSDSTKGSCVTDIALDVLSPFPGKLHVRGKTVGRVILPKNRPVMMPFPTRSGSGDTSILSDTCRGIGDVQFLRLLVGKVKFFRDLLRLLNTNLSLCHGEEPTDVLYEILTLGNESLRWDEFETWIDILKYPDGRCDQSAGHVLAQSWRADDIENITNWTPELMSCATIAASLLSNSIREHGIILQSHSAILDLLKEASQNLADQAVVSVRCSSRSGATLATTFQSVAAGDSVVLLEGADWPIVLRPKGNEWLLIGPAFVMGIMDGEAWSGEDGDIDDLIDFLLI